MPGCVGAIGRCETAPEPLRDIRHPHNRALCFRFGLIFAFGLMLVFCHSLRDFQVAVVGAEEPVGRIMVAGKFGRPSLPKFNTLADIVSAEDSLGGLSDADKCRHETKLCENLC